MDCIWDGKDWGRWAVPGVGGSSLGMGGPSLGSVSRLWGRGAESKYISLRRASQVYNIPLHTLRGHVAGVFREKNGDRRPVFTSQEEDDLVTRLKRLSEIGYRLTP